VSSQVSSYKLNSGEKFVSECDLLVAKKHMSLYFLIAIVCEMYNYM